jgi:hypothetical protein
MTGHNAIRDQSLDKLIQWLESCKQRGKLARNTVAVGIVALDHLRRTCPTTEAEVFTSGNELKGARSGLQPLLASYGVPSTYLREATTRQAAFYARRLFEAFDWGNAFAPLDAEQRDELLLELIGYLTGIAHQWLQRQNLKLELDRRHSPKAWLATIVENSRGRSTGIVEQHLVGAKLEKAFPTVEVANFPAHAADRQTSRDGDFSVASSVYHVTANPSPAVIEKCVANLRSGKHPVLVVPGSVVQRAEVLASLQNVEKEVTIISLEDFVTINIQEIADKQSKDRFEVLKDIIDAYNRRLQEVETDQSLQIELK